MERRVVRTLFCLGVTLGMRMGSTSSGTALAGTLPFAVDTTRRATVHVMAPLRPCRARFLLPSFRCVHVPSERCARASLSQAPWFSHEPIQLQSKPTCRIDRGAHSTLRFPFGIEPGRVPLEKGTTCGFERIEGRVRRWIEGRTLPGDLDPGRVGMNRTPIGGGKETDQSMERRVPARIQARVRVDPSSRDNGGSQPHNHKLASPPGNQESPLKLDGRRNKTTAPIYREDFQLKEYFPRPRFGWESN